MIYECQNVQWLSEEKGWVVYRAVVFVGGGDGSNPVMFNCFCKYCLLCLKSEGWWLVNKKKLQIIVIPPFPRNLDFLLYA